MEQKAIESKTAAIMALYCSRPNHASVPEVLNLTQLILWRRGITRSMPMYATARLLVLRDVLNELEGTYTNPAEL